jgi:hypothetical protein
MADLKNSEILENHDFNVQIPLRRLSNGEILNNMCVSESNGDKNMVQPQTTNTTKKNVNDK